MSLTETENHTLGRFISCLKKLGMSTKPNFFVQSLPAEHPQISSETAGQKCSVFVINIRSIYAFKLYKLCMIKVMYGVYVVEQVGNTPFNRAMLMNVGAAEAVKQQVSNKTVFLWIFLTQILLRITNASYSTMSTCCRRMTGICTPARYNLDTCPSPLTVSSTDFPMMISLVESVHSL